MRDRSLVRKVKIYHSERIFEAVGGINVGDYMCVGRDVSRDEGATAQVLRAKRLRLKLIDTVALEM